MKIITIQLLLLGMAAVDFVMGQAMFSTPTDAGLEDAIKQDGAKASDHWAVLVAGSKGYFNYRHQADICHAYHLLKRQGVPADQIIVMAYNDVAWDDENPFPGTLYNGKDGVNYHDGCMIDYQQDDVNKENFLSILHGN